MRRYMGVRMVQLDLNKISIEDKLKLMELIWNNLVEEGEEVPSPKWHKEKLFMRKKKLKEHKEEVLDWRDAKKDIVKVINENKNT